jgi:hypothetical protein
MLGVRSDRPETACRQTAQTPAVALLRSGAPFLRAELFLKAAKNRWIACAQTAKGHIHQNVVFVYCGSL